MGVWAFWCFLVVSLVMFDVFLVILCCLVVVWQFDSVFKGKLTRF